jgi:hypothetical protein
MSSVPTHSAGQPLRKPDPAGPSHAEQVGATLIYGAGIALYLLVVATTLYWTITIK